MAGNAGFKHLTQTQDHAVDQSKTTDHEEVKQYAYTSIHDHLNYLYYELIRMTLDSKTVFCPIYLK